MSNSLQKGEEKPSKIVIPNKIYKEKEYNAVLRLIKERKFTTIKTVSQILKIRYQTLQLWLKTKKVQRAITEEIEYYLSNMQESGKKDWKMWDRLIQYTKNEANDQEKSNITIQVLSSDKVVGVMIN